MTAPRLKLLVTGTPRSATQFFATALQRLGLKANHEACAVLPDRFVVPAGTEVDVSWCLAPYLLQLPEGVPVVHLVRDPLRTLASIVQARILTRGPGPRSGYGNMIRYHMPELRRETEEVELACRFWRQWNDLVESARWSRPYRLLRVEDLDLTELLALARLVQHEPTTEQMLLALETRPGINHRGNVKPLEWVDLPDCECSLVREQADRYGYERETHGHEEDRGSQAEA